MLKDKPRQLELMRSMLDRFSEASASLAKTEQDYKTFPDDDQLALQWDSAYRRYDDALQAAARQMVLVCESSMTIQAARTMLVKDLDKARQVVTKLSA